MERLVRDYLGEDSAGNWSDAQVARAINRSAKEVYNQIVNMNQEHFAIKSSITWVSGTEQYTLPAFSFTPQTSPQRIILMEYVNGTYKQSLRRVPIQDKEQYQGMSLVRNARAGYWYLFGNKVGFKPTPNISLANAVDVYHVPALVDLVSQTGDLLPLEWTDLQHEVVVMGAVLRCAMRSKELISVYQPNFDRLWKGLLDDMQNRDNQDAKVIRPPDLTEEC